MKFLSALCLCSVFYCACQSEIGNSEDVTTSSIYMHYTISYTEGDDSANCYLQYLFSGPKGTTLVLNSPSKVELDGTEINVDSTYLAGAFYSKNFIPVAGKEHFIKFTDIDEKAHEESFSFQPVACITKVADTINAKNNIVLELSGVNKGDILHLGIVDTTFDKNKIEKDITLTNNKIEITAKELNQMTNGPLVFQMYKTIEMPLKNGTKEGGSFMITYSLKPIETELKK